MLGQHFGRDEGITLHPAKRHHPLALGEKVGQHAGIGHRDSGVGVGHREVTPSPPRRG